MGVTYVLLRASRPSAPRFRLPSLEASAAAFVSRGLRGGKKCTSLMPVKSSGVMYMVIALCFGGESELWCGRKRWRVRGYAWAGLGCEPAVHSTGVSLSSFWEDA